MPSFTEVFVSKRPIPLVHPLTPQNDADRDHSKNPPNMAKAYKLPAQDRLPYPPMPPLIRPQWPFIARIYDIASQWVQEEWQAMETIRRDANKNKLSAAHKAAIEDCRLTPDNLAKRLDNISQATLRRELKRMGAPAPGEIIRQARLHFAKHLLTHTRILIRDVAVRAGYDDERHFTELFTREFDCKPSDFRRRMLLEMPVMESKGKSPAKARRRSKP